MITRRVEYIRSCDHPDCHLSESADWTTRSEAVQAAAKDGWTKCTRGRWLCPECAKKTPKDDRLAP